jgi:undecaprenyl-diphosphatase
VLINDLLHDTLNSPTMVGGFLIVTAGLLVTSELLGKRKSGTKQLRLSDVVFIGFAQGLAILPGISRSGSTIAAGLFRGLTREEAARFSFLLSIPVILAGAAQQIGDLTLSGTFSDQAAILIGGFIGAAITGYFAIKYFIDYLKKHSLYVFALYCFVLGTVTLIASNLK